LEAQTGAVLLNLWGLVTHGDPAEVYAAHEAVRARGYAVTMLEAAQARRRFTGMRFDGEVLLSRNAGIVYSERALAALAQAARDGGAEIRTGVRVMEIVERGDGMRVTVREADGTVSALDAGHVIVTAGAWTEGLLSGLIDLPTLSVTEEQPAHFAISDPQAVWPSFNHFLPAVDADSRMGNVYGMLSPGEGVKVGLHRVGPAVDPDSRTFQSDPALHAQLLDYVAHWFPGLDPQRFVDVSCTYTSTDSGRFILDGTERLTIGAGFSGHGFKFVPTIGRILADAALGVAAPPAPFRLPTI
jgi:sarcosine oxidase